MPGRSGTNSWDVDVCSEKEPMADYSFKTVYFPSDRTRSGSPARVTISIPRKSNGHAYRSDFLEYARSLASNQIRIALGDPVLEDLEDVAHQEGRSLSNICLHVLSSKYENGHITRTSCEVSKQPFLPFIEEASPTLQVTDQTEDGGFGVTFRESQRLPGHSWYPYVEGFSAPYVRDALLRFGTRPRNVYDPFGGAGTTQLTAAVMGIPSFYGEVNPFMSFVAETKVTSAAWARKNLPVVRGRLSRFIGLLDDYELKQRGKRVDLTGFESTFPGRDFFVEEDLRDLLAAKALAEEIGGDGHLRAIMLLACAANVVLSSNMTRRADLRRRRPDEYRTRVVNVARSIRESAQRMLSDIESLPESMAAMTLVTNDSRQLGAELAETFDIVVTSPPYLNGTNYIRNTKLELWFMGFLESEAQLADYRRQTVCAGINDVSRAREQHAEFEPVEVVARTLDIHSKDRRIPTMVRQYFSDMGRVLSSAYRSLVPGGRFVLDIGDSQFYGVHVPTDVLLIEVARSVGFSVENKHLLAKRYSKGDVELKQVELVLRKPSGGNPPRSNGKLTSGRPPDPLKGRIEEFARDLPYKQEPYTSRNWGHPLHSLSSYQGKLKPSQGYWLIKTFVPEGGEVLDPLGGVGTIAFEAALAGHRAVSNDKSPFAATVATAKIAPPTVEEALDSLEALGQTLRETHLSDQDYEAARFGLNSPVTDYYHPDTLAEVLKARKVFLSEGMGDRSRTFVWASLLHILHGNRPYALSRNSHPITPFSPTGPAEYRPLLPRLRNRITRALGEPLPRSFVPGLGIHGDFRDVPTKCPDKFDVIITSPPFMGMRFDRPNWLRLWFCGWGEQSFHKESLTFLEREQTRSMTCYDDFFRTCQQLLKPDGLMIIHVGSGQKDHLSDKLIEHSKPLFNLLADVREDVQELEKHGLKDKGRTLTHHLLFLRPR